jgi:L-serine dehydratase
MDGKFDSVLIEFDPNGSLATTHRSQGSDMGLFGGLLGWEATDERLVNSDRAIIEAGIRVKIKIKDFPTSHPNTYRITLKGSNESHELIAISTGGGMIEVIEIDGAIVSIEGDYFETLIYFGGRGEQILKFLANKISFDEIHIHKSKPSSFIEIKAQTFIQNELASQLAAKFNITKIRRIYPILPVLSRKYIKVPYLTCDEMLKYNRGKNLPLWELAIHYESERGGITNQEVFSKMKEVVGIIRDSIQNGLAGTHYEDRILGFQSGNFQKHMNENRLLDGGVLNRIILYTTAIMEMKSSMGVIVAAPTAGACGGLPGACFGAADVMGLPLEEVTKAMLAAGMIGVFIAAHATFAAEIGGCQAECGAGSGMAAAGLVTLSGGTANQAVSGASMALQNILGMICDPVANRVEVPCLGKNVLAASNALSCANMALSNFDPVLPLDEVITTMDEVGKSLPSTLRCTGLGGLSISPTSKNIESRLNLLQNQ